MVKMCISVSNHIHTKINEHEDLILSILNINKIYTQKNNINTGSGIPELKSRVTNYDVIKPS